MHLWTGMAAMAVFVSPGMLAAQDSTSGTIQYDDNPAVVIAHAEELIGAPLSRVASTVSFAF